MIKHHLDPQTAFDNYDYNQLEASIVTSGQTDDTQVNTQSPLDKLAATGSPACFLFQFSR